MSTVPLVLTIQIKEAWIFYVGDYCSLGTVHSNSSLSAKYSTLMSTVPLVLTIQIKEACTPRLFFYAGVYCCSLGTDHSNSSNAYTRQNFYVIVFCSLGMVDWQRWCLLFLWYQTEHSSLHLSWWTTICQPKSRRINITIKINCIFATTLNMDMLSKNHTKSHPVKKVGFFCYRCDRDDFGLNQKSLSAHVRYCSFDLLKH
jgi:hypothetical protein